MAAESAEKPLSILRKSLSNVAKGINEKKEYVKNGKTVLVEFMNRLGMERSITFSDLTAKSVYKLKKW